MFINRGAGFQDVPAGEHQFLEVLLQALSKCGSARCW
jgi:hypothetical protein